MGLFAWFSLAYGALVMLAGLFGASLCKVARLFGRYENPCGEVLLWGSPVPGGSLRAAGFLQAELTWHWRPAQLPSA
jgi:hypothetical protein